MASQGWPSGVTWNFTLLVMLLFAGCGGSGGDSGGSGGNPAAPTALATADDTVPVGSAVTLAGRPAILLPVPVNPITRNHADGSLLLCYFFPTVVPITLASA